MGLSYRKSKKVGKNSRVNLSTKSASFSTGVKGARVSMNTKGKSRMTLSVPGTGFRYTKTIKGGDGAIALLIFGFCNLIIWLCKICIYLTIWMCKLMIWLCIKFVELIKNLYLQIRNKSKENRVEE